MRLLQSLSGIGTATLVAAILVAGFCGCRTASNEEAAWTSPGSTATNGVSEPLRDPLLTGDRIRITFYGPPNPPAPHIETIRRDGYITPPLLGTQVMAAGKTIEELQDELHRLYVPAFYTTLTITVTADERYFFVGGFVATPGMIPYRADMTLSKAIQAAGDVTIWAWKSHVSVNRNGGGTEMYDLDEILKDPRLDPPVYPGDSVHVPRRPI